MPVIITLPDELAEKLQTEADARQQSINDCAIDFLERALENQSGEEQNDFKMLGAQMRATPTPKPVEPSKESSETKATHNEDASDFEKIGDKIRLPLRQESHEPPPQSIPRETRNWEGLRRGGQEGDKGGDKGAMLSSNSSSVPPDENSNRNDSDTSPDAKAVSRSFKTLGVQLKGKPSAIASTGWLLDPSVSPINDHKYRVDLEQWSRLWAKVKVEMKYEQLPPEPHSGSQNAGEPAYRA